MTEWGAEMILGMANDLNQSYQRGMEEGIKIGRRQVWAEIKEMLNKKNEAYDPAEDHLQGVIKGEVDGSFE